MSNKKKMDIESLAVIIAIIIIIVSTVMTIYSIIIRFKEVNTEVRNTIIVKNDQELDIVPDNYTGAVLLERVIDSESYVYMDNMEGPLLYIKRNEQVSRVERTLFISRNKWVTEASREIMSTGVTVSGVDIQDIFVDLCTEKNTNVDLLSDNRRVEYVTIPAGQTIKVKLTYTDGDIISIEKTKSMSTNAYAKNEKIETLCSNIAYLLIIMLINAVNIKVIQKIKSE